MVRGKCTAPLVAAAVLICAVAGAQTAQAGSVSAGGWTASWDDALDDVLGLTVLSENGDNVRFNKFAQFNEDRREGLFIEPLVITFERNSADAVRFLVIEQESVINDTGADWVGFNFILTPPEASGLAFDEDRSFGGSNPFDILPFDDYDLSADGKLLSVGGGIVPDVGSDVWTPGQVAGGLWIDAGGENIESFAFAEQPVPIPLPPAVLSGLATLGGIGALGRLRGIRRRRATA